MTSDTTGQRLTDAEQQMMYLYFGNRFDDGIAQMVYRHEAEAVARDLIATRAELAELRQVVAEAVAALRQCNYAVIGLPGCITDGLHRVPLTYEDERSVGERETYTAIRALVATASTEQEPRQ
jgi:hypothetical protein